MPKDTYLFPTGAIREREKKLFDANDMERMIDADDVSKSFKIFNELSYADELLDMQSPSQYREVLAHDLGQIKEFLATITPDPVVLGLVLAYYDFHNFKMLLKAKYSGQEEVEHTSELGSIPAEKLTEIILKQNTKIVLPGEYDALLKEAIKELEKNHKPQEIDSYFDKKYFAHILQLSKTLKNELLINLVKTKIDIANIKIVIRSKLLERQQENVKRDIVPGGNISDHDFLANYSKELPGLVKNIQQTFTDTQITNEFDRFLENQELWQLEKVLDNHLINLLRELGMKSQGPATIAAYFLAKKNAIKNIQIVMTGKINGIDSKEIKERVRELY